MIFNIVVDPPVLKELRKIKKGSPHISSHLIKSIDALVNDPFIGKPLKGIKKGCYSLREGDYRVIYEVHKSEGIIHIMTVGHRREIYR